MSEQKTKAWSAYLPTVLLGILLVKGFLSGEYLMKIQEGEWIPWLVIGSFVFSLVMTIKYTLSRKRTQE